MTDTPPTSATNATRNLDLEDKTLLTERIQARVVDRSSNMLALAVEFNVSATKVKNFVSNTMNRLKITARSSSIGTESLPTVTNFSSGTSLTGSPLDQTPFPTPALNPEIQPPVAAPSIMPVRAFAAVVAVPRKTAYHFYLAEIGQEVHDARIRSGASFRDGSSKESFGVSQIVRARTVDGESEWSRISKEETLEDAERMAKYREAAASENQNARVAGVSGRQLLHMEAQALKNLDLAIDQLAQFGWHSVAMRYKSSDGSYVLHSSEGLGRQVAKEVEKFQEHHWTNHFDLLNQRAHQRTLKKKAPSIEVRRSNFSKDVMRLYSAKLCEKGLTCPENPPLTGLFKNEIPGISMTGHGITFTGLSFDKRQLRLLERNMRDGNVTFEIDETKYVWPLPKKRRRENNMESGEDNENDDGSGCAESGGAGSVGVGSGAVGSGGTGSFSSGGGGSGSGSVDDETN
ncbi:hypothetical protein HDU98_005328 [Podochytrium sp. JEL0797]|nr:hypothetical protein HDU98_005328 [Podochytrium sp. JEL0797]